MINGQGNDFLPLPYGKAYITNKEYGSLLITHISQTGNLGDDLNLHLKKRFPRSTKFFNFLRSNMIAPLYFKINVLKARVINSLLLNCETFGATILKDLESVYQKLIKATLGEGHNTPNDIVFIAANLLSLEATIYCRLLNCFKRCQKSLEDGGRKKIILINDRTSHVKHYMDLEESYDSIEDINLN